MKHNNVTLVAGPTASGKSSMALKIARENNAIVVNADSMQVYDVLSVITARPDSSELEQAPHFLYGHVSPADTYSTGHWLRDVQALLEAVEPDQHIVFVGGTGLYFKALLGGLSPMPKVANDVREDARARLLADGAAKLHEHLTEVDPEMAATLNQGDGQRIARALEVIRSTGRSLLWWQTQPGEALINPETCQRFVLHPNRTWLKARIDKRFDQMMELGALNEVKALLALKLDPSMPAMKAIGVQNLERFLAGQISYDEAIELSKIATRQYAKRQMTWFRNQLDENWQKIDPSI